MFSGSRTPSYQFWFFEAISSTLKMGTESVPEMLENLHILTGYLPKNISINSCHKFALVVDLVFCY